MKIISDPKLACAEFQYLYSAMIDASSIIYMQKAGFLNLVMQNLELASLPEILKETGFEIRTIKCLKSADAFDSNDRKLVETAQRYYLPVISEDKKILKRAGSEGLPYYNSLMMLNFLYFKEAIDIVQYNKFLKRLKSFARYNEIIFDYGAAVFDAIHTIRQKNPKSSESENTQHVRVNEIR